jgi:hypothetical protein
VLLCDALLLQAVPSPRWLALKRRFAEARNSLAAVGSIDPEADQERRHTTRSRPLRPASSADRCLPCSVLSWVAAKRPEAGGHSRHRVTPNQLDGVSQIRTDRIWPLAEKIKVRHIRARDPMRVSVHGACPADNKFGHPASQRYGATDSPKVLGTSETGAVGSQAGIPGSRRAI